MLAGFRRDRQRRAETAQEFDMEAAILDGFDGVSNFHELLRGDFGSAKGRGWSCVSFMRGEYVSTNVGVVDLRPAESPRAIDLCSSRRL